MGETASNCKQFVATATAFCGCLGFVLFFSGVVAAEPAAERLQFNRDVRPILSEACFACHGPDAAQREADLRLDLAESAQSIQRDRPAIVAGKPEESELVRRIDAEDPDERMPPPHSKKELTALQKTTLRRWIEQGAEYEPHWSLNAPVWPEAPSSRQPSVREVESGIREANANSDDRALVDQSPIKQNPIDAFVSSRLQAEGLTMSPPADRSILVRRLSFDLTGLPPSLDELDAALADSSADWYETLVERLLDSPHYGERMAMDWLDAARYADTHGFHLDSARDMWRWRDWVIDAFNGNMPFDRFTIEQLAGDLLPNATIDQIIATGFNRNHPINYEGGAIPEEYHVAYVVDRVSTTGAVWMGLTLGCAQCHDHKFDPITQREFYQLYAYFNNLAENGIDGTAGNAVPYIKAPRKEQQQALEELARRRSAIRRRMDERRKAVLAESPNWEQQLRRQHYPSPDPLGQLAHYGFNEQSGHQVADATGQQQPARLIDNVVAVEGKVGGALKFDGSGYVDCGPILPLDRDDKFSLGAWVLTDSKSPGAILARTESESHLRGYDLIVDQGRVFFQLVSQGDSWLRVSTKQAFTLGQWHHVIATYDGSSRAQGIKIYINGVSQELDVYWDLLGGSIRTSKPFQIGARAGGLKFEGLLDEVHIYRRQLGSVEVAILAGKDEVRSILDMPAIERTASQIKTIQDRFLLATDGSYQSLARDLDELDWQVAEIEKLAPTTMVMREMPNPRETYLLERGQYDQPGDKVSAGVPKALPPLPPGAPNNRLGLAQWLVHPSHPLTARVAVNRIWQSFFGTGLVKTAEDFGSQGEPPSHPELLDWLAKEFIRSGWNVKSLQRLIVTSATYRQSSKVPAKLLAADPENRLLARGSRFRLPAEMIRDNALCISDLLVPEIGGPSVMPYESPGLWDELAYGGGFSAQRYQQGSGEDLYRRSIYTFWKRTVPPAALNTLDAPDREACVVRRSRTNTPLQALVLLNDPTYVEASRRLAELMMASSSDDSQRIAFAFRKATARIPTEVEIEILHKLYNQRLAAFQQDGAAALAVLHVGQAERNEELNSAELAAWTTVASAILNLDETITRQ